MAAAPTVPLISEEEYLETPFEYTTEFVDGELIQKSVTQLPQGKLLMLLIKAIAKQEDALGIAQYADMMMRVATGRYRAPDLMILPADHPDKTIITTAPLITFEVLSEDDRIKTTRLRIRDHLAMGVQQVVVVDPGLNEVHLVGPDGIWVQLSPPLNVQLPLPNGKLKLDFDDMFARL